MGFTVTGRPSEEALSQLIESLLNHIIEYELYKIEVTAPGTEAEAVTTPEHGMGAGERPIDQIIELHVEK